MTVILVEHKIDEVIPWVDRVLLMDDGKIVLDEPPRRAFVDPFKWDRLGVAVPEVTQLSQRMPAAFGGQLALTVREAVDALKGTTHQQSLVRSATHHTTRSSTSSAEQPKITWNQVNLAYGARRVLKDINLSVYPGEWVALAGPNGSGKTSLASLAMGFQEPSSGSIRLNGQVVEPGNISRQASNVAYLFQAADNILFASTVRDELKFGTRYGRKTKHKHGGHSVEELSRMIDLQHHMSYNPFHLSHGQRKRLAIGALLAANPQVMILDEPTTGQDEGHARMFLEFLHELRRQWALTFLMITHDMRAVARYASRLAVLQDGEVVMNAAPAEVFAQASKLAEASVVPPPIAHLHGLLCNETAQRVALDVDEFLQLLTHQEVLV